VTSSYEVQASDEAARVDEVLLGGAINNAAAETRTSLSWDAQTLYFGRAPGPEGMSDISVATRSKLKGSDR